MAEPTIDKKQIIQTLENIGTILMLKGENPFKSRAYFNAARMLETRNDDIVALIQSGEISNIKGIGKALSEKLSILVKEGRLPYYEKLKESIPPGLMDMLNIPGMGPKKVKAVYDQLGIKSVGELEYACNENRLRDLPGFGLKSQEKILKGIELRKKYSERFLFPIAWQQALQLTDYMRKNPQLIRLTSAGSLRRKKETVKDIDLVGSCKEEQRLSIMDYFVRYPLTESIVNRGQTKSTILLQSGISCDLRLVDDEQFPFALHHSTGSKEHNTAMRHRAKTRHLTMNEYGLFPRGSEQSLPCSNEVEIFQTLQLDFIPPELRENQGEIEAAEKNNLPELITEDQIKGVFHVHSVYSDGAASIADLVRACRNKGYHYLGISDHSKSVFYAHGLSEDRVKMQHEEIDRLNSGMNDFVIFKGIEVDILNDGGLDYDDEVLASFDFVIASVHSSFRMSKEEMTHRICQALKHPLVTMLGHPTGRLLLAREPYPLDMRQVLETAAEQNKIIEINANPHRLDLDWRWGKLANQLGVKTSINPDAHTLAGLEDIKWGVGIARKGWFTAEQVLNTHPVQKIKQLFHCPD